MSLATANRALYAGPPTVPGYVVGEFLGRGSSAVVWAATGPAGERVALKVFSGDRAPTRRDEVLDDTARELGLSRRVTSGHVVAARERLELDDGRVVLVLDLAEEGTLRDVVTVRGALPLGEAVTALIGVATGLADLETGGVLHGDVAPGNVLFDRDGRPLLADLSMARLVADGSPPDLFGTPGFTAPEVLAGRPPTPASDVWALGALLWYARTGGRTPPAWVGDAHWLLPGVATDGPGLDEVAQAVGPELSPVLVRLLADDPHVRPTAAEAALAIYRAAAPEPVGLVGRHPDPASAVTTRLRREAVETRSRRELQALQKAERREAQRRGGGRRRGRGRASGTAGGATRDRPGSGTRSWWRVGSLPRSRAGSGSGAGSGAGAAAGSLTDGLVPPEVAALRPGLAPVGWSPATVRPDSVGERSAPSPWRSTGSAALPATPATPATPRTPRSAGVRVAAVSAAGVVVAAGLLGLVAATGRSAPAPDSPVGATTATGSASTATGSGTSASAVAAAPVSGLVTASEPAPSWAAASPGQLDPVTTLQTIADARAAALSAADPVALVAAEPVGTPAYSVDSATVVRLREQRQRYRDLAFTVSAADVVSRDGGRAVVRAVVGRSASTVEGEDGSVQTLAATPGEPLRYVLTLTDGGWRLTEVTSG